MELLEKYKEWVIFMQEILANIDWISLIGTLWTVVLLPLITYIGTEVHKCMKSKKIDKYADILQKHIESAVKDMQETIVKNIKNNPELWTEETQIEIKEIAKVKALNALGNAGCECLKSAIEDFDLYLDSLVGSALYDIKNK